MTGPGRYGGRGRGRRLRNRAHGFNAKLRVAGLDADFCRPRHAGAVSDPLARHRLRDARDPHLGADLGTLCSLARILLDADLLMRGSLAVQAYRALTPRFSEADAREADSRCDFRTLVGPGEHEPRARGRFALPSPQLTEGFAPRSASLRDSLNASRLGSVDQDLGHWAGRWQRAEEESPRHA